VCREPPEGREQSACVPRAGWELRAGYLCANNPKQATCVPRAGYVSKERELCTKSSHDIACQNTVVGQDEATSVQRDEATCVQKRAVCRELGEGHLCAESQEQGNELFARVESHLFAC